MYIAFSLRCKLSAGVAESCASPVCIADYMADFDVALAGEKNKIRILRRVRVKAKTKLI